MTTPLDLEALRVAIARMERDWHGASDATELAETLRDELGARFGDTGGNGCVRFKLAGITAQSTAGLTAAMMSWLGKAREAVEQAKATLS